MKTYPGIDYDFQPVSYWDYENVLQVILRDVKGAARRKMIKDYLIAGRFQELDDKLLETKLSNETRDKLSAIHPMFMGGEYLPDYSVGETEIARIELKSTTFDVISIRAAAEEKGIRYSVMDEYGFDFKLYKETSKKPFTLAELIEFIDNIDNDYGYAGDFALSYNYSQANYMMPRELLDFTSIESDIYGQLKEHYDHVFVYWVYGDFFDQFSETHLEYFRKEYGSLTSPTLIKKIDEVCRECRLSISELDVILSIVGPPGETNYLEEIKIGLKEEYEL